MNPKVALYSGETQNVDYTPGADVAAGDVIVTNGVARFAQSDIASGKLGALASQGGVWKGNKITGAIARGDAIFWDATGNPVTGTAGTGALTKTYAAGLLFVGYAAAAAASGDQFVYFEKVLATSALRAVSGQHTTVTASDTKVTGLSVVVSAIAGLDSDPTDDPEWVTASIGDQAGTPAAGSILIKTWKNTGGTDPTPAAAGTFTKKVNWTAWGY